MFCKKAVFAAIMNVYLLFRAVSRRKSGKKRTKMHFYVQTPSKTAKTANIFPAAIEFRTPE